MTPEEKKLWQCYHARAMQAIVSNPSMVTSLNSSWAASIAVEATTLANAMLAEAKKKGAV